MSRVADEVGGSTRVLRQSWRPDPEIRLRLCEWRLVKRLGGCVERVWGEEHECGV